MASQRMVRAGVQCQGLLPEFETAERPPQEAPELPVGPAEPSATTLCQFPFLLCSILPGLPSYCLPRPRASETTPHWISGLQISIPESVSRDPDLG